MASFAEHGRVKRCAILPLIGVFLACGGGDPDGVDHGCTVEANSEFFALELTLDHSDSRACEMNHGPGSIVSSTATVYEDSIVESPIAPVGVVGVGIRVRVDAWDSWDYNLWQGIFSLTQLSGTVYEDFEWGTPMDPFASPGEWQWQAGGTIVYGAGDSPDYVEHAVWNTLTLNDAIGLLVVEHSGGGGGPGM